MKHKVEMRNIGLCISVMQKGRPYQLFINKHIGDSVMTSIHDPN